MPPATHLTIRVSEDLRDALDEALRVLSDDPRMMPPGSLGKLTRSDVARRALVIGVRELMRERPAAG